MKILILVPISYWKKEEGGGHRVTGHCVYGIDHLKFIGFITEKSHHGDNIIELLKPSSYILDTAVGVNENEYIDNLKYQDGNELLKHINLARTTVNPDRLIKENKQLKEKLKRMEERIARFKTKVKEGNLL